MEKRDEFEREQGGLYVGGLEGRKGTREMT